MIKKNLISIIASLLFITALILWFTVPVFADGGNNHNNLLSVTFGASQTVPILGSIPIFNFSFLNFLAILLLVLGGLTLLMANLLKFKDINLISLVAATAIIIAGVLFLFTRVFTIISITGNNPGSDVNLTFGVILMAIITIISGALFLPPINEAIQKSIN
jgi:hypothetical protein